jgi:Ca2+-binding EF-hand superfamily protein
VASILCEMSAQFTQNIFLRLDVERQGYLDKRVLGSALKQASQDEVDILMRTLDQDGDARVTPHELNLAIIDWLSEHPATQVLPAFAKLVRFYGLD